MMIGSFATKAKEAVDRLREAGQEGGAGAAPAACGPFPAATLRQALAGKKAVAVIDQNLSMGKGGVLHGELASALYGHAGGAALLASFVGGLGGRDISSEEFFEMAQGGATGSGRRNQSPAAAALHRGRAARDAQAAGVARAAQHQAGRQTMSDTAYQHLKDLPARHILGTGTPMCAGCGGLAALHAGLRRLGREDRVRQCGRLHDAALGLSLHAVSRLLAVHRHGLRPGRRAGRARRARHPAREGAYHAGGGPEVVVLTGDGAAYGMGLSATSGAIERGLDFLYLCYDNEGYGNTGQQFSPATPHGARTATSKGSRGYPGYKKDLFAIWAAHQPATSPP